MNNLDKEEKIIPWLGLCLGLRGDYRLMEKIIKRFVEAAAVWKASPLELQEIGLEDKVIQFLHSGKALHQAQETLASLKKKGFWVMSRDDPAYPVLLAELPNAPFLLFGAGDKELLAGPAVAVVGAREPSPYGRLMAEKLAADLASRGLVVVSGLARGIDAWAHSAALKEGKTIAVLGSGLERVYPPENLRLFRQITEKGAVITEYPPQEPPLSHHFPWRNRLISGLSLATVVVEASERSGSLITARLALDQNREVMAVPGRVGHRLSRGTNRLIKAGAKLVEGWEDVVLELPCAVRDAILEKEKDKLEVKKLLPVLEEEEKAILAYLEPDDMLPLEVIVERSGQPVPELLATLLQLELKGLVISGPGPSYQRSG